ncbi:hypothetical protein QJS66_13690 [Kocuria rhizophila]|nr:hypothetical protein QJS66_13690 [Kocuria rhizophila]
MSQFRVADEAPVRETRARASVVLRRSTLLLLLHDGLRVVLRALVGRTGCRLPRTRTCPSVLPGQRDGSPFIAYLGPAVALTAIASSSATTWCRRRRRRGSCAPPWTRRVKDRHQDAAAHRRGRVHVCDHVARGHRKPQRAR